MRQTVSAGGQLYTEHHVVSICSNTRTLNTFACETGRGCLNASHLKHKDSFGKERFQK